MRAPVMIAAAAAVATLAFHPVQAADTDPHAFLTKAIEGDNSEITLGRVAEHKGASPEVRRFGAMLVHDHAASRVQAEKIASAFGVKPTSELQPEAKDELNKLHGLSGKAFDQEFARYMVQDHRKDIDDFNQEAQGGQPRLAAFAKKTLPTLHKHLDMAEHIQGQEG